MRHDVEMRGAHLEFFEIDIRMFQKQENKKNKNFQKRVKENLSYAFNV